MTVAEEIEALNTRISALRNTPCAGCSHEYAAHTLGRLGPAECKPVVQVSVNPWKQRAIRCRCVRFVDPEEVPALFGQS